HRREPPVGGPLWRGGAGRRDREADQGRGEDSPARDRDRRAREGDRAAREVDRARRPRPHAARATPDLRARSRDEAGVIDWYEKIYRLAPETCGTARNRVN